MASSSEGGLNKSTLHPVWKKLPVELVELVLKCVPFESLVRFRAVCKRFNSLITSPKFARKCQRQQASKPVPIIVPDIIQQESCSVKVFNTKTNSWLTCQLSISEDDLFPLEIATASEGLVCFESASVYARLNSPTFVVYNLLTRAFKRLELPTPRERDFNFERALITSLIVNLQAGTFTLVVLTSSNEGAGTKISVYDSADGSWRSGAPLPDIGPDMRCFNRTIFFNTVTSNGSIYVCLISFEIHSWIPTVMLKLDVRNDRWSEISLANVQYYAWEYLEILEHRRKVVLVSTRTVVNNVDQSHLKKIFYVVRDAAAGHGETVVEDRMVFQALDDNEWTKDGGHDVATVGIGDVICIARSKGDGSPMRVLLFNSSTQELSLLPDCGMGGQLSFKLMLLEPSLTVDL